MRVRRLELTGPADAVDPAFPAAVVQRALARAAAGLPEAGAVQIERLAVEVTHRPGRADQLADAIGDAVRTGVQRRAGGR